MAIALPREPAASVEPPTLSPADQEYFDDLVNFVETLPPGEAAQMKRLAEVGRQYGDDFERRFADWEAGRHPLQRRR